MGKKPATETPPLEYSNPFQDHSSRFELDALLRQHGFRIRSRKTGQEPVWERYGDEFRQRDALRMIPNEEIEKARRLENIYYGKTLGKN